MARVQLYLRPTDPAHEYRFVRPDGTVSSIPGLRLFAYVRLMGLILPGRARARLAFPECDIDTGAFLSIVPGSIWQFLRPGVVTPLPFDPSMPARHQVITIANGTFPYELGELSIPIVDKMGRTLTPRVVAKFTRDGGALALPLVLGLRGGVLDGRVLRAEPSPAAPFGQAWVLEDL